MTGTKPKKQGRRGLVGAIRDVDTPIKLLALAIVAVEAMFASLIWKAEGTEQFVAVIALMGVTLCLAMLLGYKLTARAGPKTGTESGQLAPESSTLNYDVFISAPMSALDNDAAIQKNNEQIATLKEAMKDYCNYNNVFYAGTDISSVDEFDPEGVALKSNLAILRESNTFVLVWPKNLASSVLLEVGMAVALGKPIAMFVHENTPLPYLLKGVRSLSNAAFYEYRSIDQIVQHLKKHKKDLFPIV